jgi:LysM repeat protein
MARFLSNFSTARRGWKGGGVYLIAALVLFAGIVFFLFRGRSSGPQEATLDPAPETQTDVRSEAAIPAPQPAVTTASNPATTTAPEVATAALVQTVPSPAVASQTPAEPAGTPNLQAQAAVDEALALLQSQPGAVVEVRNRLNKVLLMPMSPQQRDAVKSEMAKLADKWLWGPAAFPGDTLCDTYTVNRGERLEIIGRRLKVPHEILMQINNIPRPEALQAGKALKVVKGPFHVKVCRSTFTLDLYLQDTYVRSFKVGLGKPGYETPTGLWRVQDGGKLIAPDWTDPDNPGRVYKATDPDYPLGSRWIALDGIEGAAKGRTGFAIHGTKEPEQIGSAGSRGCIRMYNGEAVLMYNLLVPLYSQVEVFD